LQLAVNWREKQKPNLAWAVRYNPAFERTMVYLKTSEEEYIAEEENKIRLQKRALRRSRIVALVLGSAGMISIGLGILALIQRQDALKSQALAVRNAEEATLNAQRANKEKLAADSARFLANEQKNIAEQKKIEADQQRQNAVISATEAEKQRNIAQDQTVIAKQKQKEADSSAKVAIAEQQKADVARQEADRRKMLSIAQSMAVKSEQMRTDTLLKGLLAFQAYSFNKEYGGLTYDPDIFKSAYTGLKFFKGASSNVMSGHTSLVRSIIQSQDKLFSGSSDGQLLRWNLVGKTRDTILSNLPIVKRLIESNQSIICLTNGSIIKFDLATNISDIFPLVSMDIKDMYLTKSGKYIMQLNQSIILTDDYKNAGIEFYKSDVKINASKYDIVSGNLFVALSDGRIYFWKNFQSEQDNPTLLANIPDGNWGDISFNPQKNIVAAGTANNQGVIYLWNLNTGEQLSVLRGHTGRITKISFSNSGALMASASYDNSVRLWHMDDLKTLPIVFDDHGAWATAVAFTKDDKYIISGDKNGNLRKLPTDVTTLINDYCGYLTRDLTPSEWSNYVGTDITYKPTKCVKK